jgi:hypothetical protein
MFAAKEQSLEAQSAYRYRYRQGLLSPAVAYVDLMGR